MFTVTSAQRPQVKFNPVIDAAIEQEMVAERNVQVLIKAIDIVCVVAAIPSEGGSLEAPFCRFALTKSAQIAIQATALGVIDGTMAQHGVVRGRLKPAT